MQVSDGVDQRVGPQDDAGALGPLGAHQAVLAQQDLADVFCARHPDDGLPEQVGLEHVAVALSARDVEVGTLQSKGEIWIMSWSGLTGFNNHICILQFSLTALDLSEGSAGACHNHI